MKPMRTELTPLRRKRCEAVISGYSDDSIFDFLRYGASESICDMLTDEAVEQLAFWLMDKKRRQNLMNARNRAVFRAHEHRLLRLAVL
jgi:hypothetical protein